MVPPGAAFLSAISGVKRAVFCPRPGCALRREPLAAV